MTSSPVWRGVMRGLYYAYLAALVAVCVWAAAWLLAQAIWWVAK